MKKRILSLSLVFSILASMVVMPTKAAPVTSLTDPCPCNCGSSLSQVQWLPWNVNEEGNPPSGHYYLDDDYTQTSQKTIGAGSRIVLDLRGHKLTQEAEGKLFLLYGYMAVLDSVGGGCISTSPKADALASAFMVHFNDTGVGELELHSGTVTTEDTGKGSLNGGLVYVGTDCTFRMLGGMLLSGRTEGSGGAIYGASGSTIEIENGSITDCYAKSNGGSIYSSGTTSVKNCKIWGGKAGNFGGNLYQTGGKLTINNSDIAYGSSESTSTTNYGGGNLCSLSSATVDVCNTTIRDGYASYNGGNVYYTTGNYTFTNTVIQGGVCRSYGANLATFSNNNTTMEHCTITGDVRYGAGTLTLKGTTKIGLNNNGLDLLGSTTTVIDASGLTDGAEIFVEANGVFTQAGANQDYFKPALRTGDITANTDGCLTASQVSSGKPGGYCPHCNQRVTWTRFGTEADKVGFDNNHNLYNGHYYLDANGGYLYNLNANIDFVLDLNSKSLSVSNRMFLVNGDSSLSVLDSGGGGRLTAKGINNSSVDGGLIYNKGFDFRLNVYGGQLVYQRTENRIIKSGGVVFSMGGKSQIHISGGLLDGSTQNNTASDANGGVIYLDGADTNERGFTMTAGRILGGNVNHGGAIYLGNYANTTITGGVVTGGTASGSGGNLYLKGSSSAIGSVRIENCAFLNGTATTNGGNIYAESQAGQITNCYLAGGQASSYGGNLRIGIAIRLTVADTVLLNGTSPKGGNLYTAATNADLTLTNCTALNGKATGGSGGNIFFNNGKNTVKGGVFLFGSATDSGGNIHTNAGNHATDGQFTKLEADKSGNAPLVCAGQATANGGNIHTVGITELSAARIAGGKANNGKDLYFSKGATNTQLSIGADVIGDISLGVMDTLLSDEVYGEPIANTVSQGTEAKITLEGNFGQPAVVSKNGKLYVGSTSVVDPQGKETWYADNATAVNACGKAEYVKLYTNNDLILTKDCAVDLNGHSIRLSGAYTFIGMDSSGDQFRVPAGKVIGASIQNRPLISAPNGNTYYAITDDTGITYHRLEMRLTDIALRPSSVGIYYQAAWSCDDVLDDLVSQYGLVVSVCDIPGVDFSEGAEARENEWVAFDGTIADGEKKCGVLIQNILKGENSVAQNKENADMNIYANAYIIIDGVTYLADGANYSLKTFMEVADEMIAQDPHRYNMQERALQEFYEAWLDDVMQDWSFRRLNIPTASGPLCDGKTLKLLAITSSFGLNTTQLLYDIAKAEGCENVIVGRLYASGCTLKSHDSNAKNNTPAYDYTKNETGTWVTRLDTTMEYGLLDEDWDIIFIQQSAAQAPLVSTYGTYIDSIMAYVQKTKTNPAARFIWNMTWAYQGDSTQTVFVETFHSDQMAMYESILSATREKVVGRTDFNAIIPTGTAIQNARTSYFGDTLTKDTYHLNNLGRAIAGYTVWSILTQKPLTQVNLGPVNSYDLPQLLHLTDTDRQVIIDAVNKAIAKPFEVTASAYPTK